MIFERSLINEEKTVYDHPRFGDGPFSDWVWNRQMIDLTYSYKYAIISLPNGEIVEGKVDSWRDYEDGDQVQVTIESVTYLVHAADVVLMTEEN